MLIVTKNGSRPTGVRDFKFEPTTLSSITLNNVCLKFQSAELAFLCWCREIRERSRDVWIRRKLYETGVDFGPVTEAIDLVVLVEVSCFKVGAFSEEILSCRIELFPGHRNRIRTYIGIPETIIRHISLHADYRLSYLHVSLLIS